MKDDTKELDYHYYSASCLGWSVHEDLLKCLLARKKVDRQKGNMIIPTMCNLFRVPLPKSANYTIDNYVPEVEGTEFIATIKY